MVGAGNRAAFGSGVEGGKIAAFEKIEKRAKNRRRRRTAAVNGGASKKFQIFFRKKMRFCLTCRFAADKIGLTFHRNVELIEIVNFF